MNGSSAEQLSRFLPDKKSYFSPKNERVKWAAFMPTNTGRTSVYRTTALPDPDIWDLATNFVEPQLGPIVARADIPESAVTGHSLTMDADAVPHQRHVNLTGWPATDEQQKVIALALASIAHFVRRPANAAPGAPT